jgi:hypothetical protein
VSGVKLLDEVIEAHGGLDRYRSANEISARVRCGGWAFVMRFQRGALADFTGTVSTSEPRAVLSPYPKPGQQGVLEGEKVRIESSEGETLAERDRPREAFRSFRRNVWWDDLDLLYFAGYALWGYLSAPFVFTNPGFEVQEVEPWREDAESWRGLRVLFPESIPAHSREQLYYFDGNGLIRRNDYTAEVFSSWAKAAHYCWDHESFSGLVVPTRRKAMPRRRNGRPLTGVTVVWLQFGDVKLAPASGRTSAPGS